MTNSGDDYATKIFVRAMYLDEPERGQFIADACGADPELKRRVLELVASVPMLESDFLEPPELRKTRILPTMQSVPPQLGGYVLQREIGRGGMGVV
ncbi:MAG: hypothetical protein ABIP94_21325, partial [Planctomycetota bacterium]